ncbi:MAG: thioredoxin family protein [Nocardioidaceae bacterium]
MNDSQVKEINDGDFGEVVLQAPGPVVVEFFATWCGNCHRLAPILGRLAKDQIGRVKFVQINADDNPHAVGTYQATSTPTLMLFTAGQRVATIVGAQPGHSLRSWLEGALATTPSAGDSWVAADACTLPTVEQPLRIAEFGRLFAEALQEVQRLSPTRLRLQLDTAAEATAKDLAERETDCCSFFTFSLSHPSRGAVSMDVEVPAGRQDVLDGLATQATSPQGA